MKPTALLPCLLVAASLMSCTKENASTYIVTDSDMIPQISVGQNNIQVISQDMAPGFYEFPVSTNVISSTASYDDSSMRGISLWGVQEGEYGIASAVRFGFGSRDGYTSDAVFLLVQPSYRDGQTRYVNYGIVETMVNFRIIGSEGTFYLDASEVDKNADTHLSKCTVPCRYLLSTVKGFGEIVERNLPYLQASDCSLQGDRKGGYIAEILPVIVESNGVELTLLVSGKKRDGEIERLLKYISVGDMIETRLPATAYNKDTPHVLSDIYSCYILKK